LERPGSALIGSIVVHFMVVGAVVLALSLSPRERASLPVTNSVPVSIISEMVVPAGPADAPSDEPAAEAPADVAEPEPPTPVPTPRTPPPPRPAPSPTLRPPQKTTPPRPTPSRPTPPRPTPPREDSLDLGALAKRPTTSPAPSRPPRPPSGDRGNGAAGRATGPQIQNISGQISSRWDFQCDLPGARDLIVPVTMRIGANGRVTDGPDFSAQGSGAAWRSAVDTMQRAIAAAQPFRLPEGWTEQTLSFRFRADVVCANQ